MVSAAVQESVIGTSRHSPRRNILDAIGGIADIGRYSWSFRRFSDGSFLRASAAWDGTGCKTAGQPQPAPLSTDCQFPACRSDDAFVGAPPAVRPQGAAHRKCFQASECRKRQFGGCFSDHAPPQTHQAAFDRFVEFQRIPTRPTKTNAYQRDQRQTNRIPKEIPVTPHALKLPGTAPIRDKGA
jgi:hypothetical protein